MNLINVNGTNYETEQAIKYLKSNREAVEYMNDFYLQLSTPEDMRDAFENELKDNNPDLKTERIIWRIIHNFFILSEKK